MQEVRQQYVGEVFKDTIHQTTGVAEAVEENMPLQYFEKQGKFAEVKAALAGIRAEFERRVKEKL